MKINNVRIKMHKIIKNIKSHPKKSLTIALVIIVLLITSLAILKKIGVLAETTGTISNTAKIFYDLNGSTYSANSNTVLTSITTSPSPSPSISASPSPSPSISPSPSTSPGIQPLITALTLIPSGTVKAKSYITFNTTWTAPAGTRVTLHICKTNAISGTSCSNGSFCDLNTASSNSTVSCRYKASNGDINKSPVRFYAFVCNTSNICSASNTSQFSVVK